MNRSAVAHIPASQYAFARSEDTFTVRLRAAKGDLDLCTLFYGDRACPDSPVSFTSIPMQRRYSDELFDFYEGTIHPCPRRICYFFRLEKGDEYALYYADEFHKDMPDLVMEDGFVVEGRSEYYQYPYILRSEIVRAPEWFLNAVVYNIFPDSFADGKARLCGMGKELEAPHGTTSKSRLGGTIKGIMENLDYIQELGFTCLYLNPVFQGGEYHKYDIVDYFHVDPCMGTDTDFLELTEAVHNRGMHIIIDGVFNHCSWYFPPFDDVVKHGNTSAYADWFYDLSFPVKRPQEGEAPGYACFAYEPKMPKLNTAHPGVQEYFAKVGRYWIEKFHVDGWRLDVANEVDKNFWRSFRFAVHKADPKAVLIGEVWENAADWLKGDMFDSVMNYDFRKHCRDFFALEKTGADDFLWRMADMQLRYPFQVTAAQLNLLDSHDVARFLGLCGGDYDRWQAAFLYLCMAPGVPSIFYGDEKKVTGIRETEYRRGMPWDEKHTDSEDFVKTVLRIRRDWISPEDEWRAVYGGHDDKMIVFERYGAHTVRVIIHMGEAPADAERFMTGGQFLLLKGAVSHMLEKNGFAVLLMA